MSEKIALVLSGGGSKGAIDVGLYQAINELGMKVDFIVGTSIGAVNGAFIASGVPPAEVAALWRNLKTSDLYGFNWENLWKFFKADSLYDHYRFRGFLERYLPVETFEELKTPLIVPCTNFQTGQPLYVRMGNLVDALMASTAMPGIFPPQTCQGYQLVDGAVTENVPLEVAVNEGATTILTMQYNCCTPSDRPVHGLLKILTRAFSIALDRKTMCDIRQYGSKARLIVMEPAFGLNIDLLDFRHSQILMEKAYTFSKEFLAREIGKS
ncbi:MAG: patatin-like phospholipase family protein [Nitrospirae bacterium]|nr:patatin-like phospholipase family protein [Nitrospirota bacterium]MBI3352722.1 patatin-like phospholipase family protein [Nitrospirota bacterium]